VDPGDGQPCSGVRGESHVERLGKRRGIRHRHEWPDVDGLAGNHVETRGRVHPGIRDDHEDSREDAADRHDDAGEQVGASAHAIPPVQVDPEEDCFREERKPFERERHADDGPGKAHEAGPQEPELEGEDGSRDGSDGEQDGGALGPSLGKVEVDGVTRAGPAPLGDHHEGGESDADHREHDVEAEGHGHLASRGEQVGHGGCDLRHVRPPEVDE
jgi:hypothetical protein